MTVSSLLHLLLNYLWLIKKNTVPLSSNSGFGNCPLCLLSSKRIFIIWFSGCIPSLLEKFLPSLLPNVKPAKQSLTWAPERDNYSDQIYPENIHWQDFLINLLTDICILKAFFTQLIFWTESSYLVSCNQLLSQCLGLWNSSTEFLVLCMTDSHPWFLGVYFIALVKLSPVYQIISLLFISPLFSSLFTFVCQFYEHIFDRLFSCFLFLTWSLILT